MASTVVELLSTDVGIFRKADPFDPDLEDGVGWYVQLVTSPSIPPGHHVRLPCGRSATVLRKAPRGSVVLLIPGERVPELDEGDTLLAGEQDGSEA